jgi:O-antigen ligase
MRAGTTLRSTPGQAGRDAPIAGTAPRTEPAVRRPRALDAGMFLIVVALPIAFFPLSEAAFVDVKLPVLALGTLLIWWSGLRVDPRLAGPALALAAAFVVATLVGVDPAQSLVGTARPTGLVMLLCALTLLAVAPSIPANLVARARTWALHTALAVGCIAVVERFAPIVLDPVARDETFLGSTLGNPVFLAGLLAAAIPAAVAETQGWRRTVISCVVLGAGLAVLGERSAYVLPVVAMAAAWWLARAPSRRLALVAGTLAVSFAVTVVVATTFTDGPAQPTRVTGQFSTLTAERQRFAVWNAEVIAVTERPLFGWGPGNEWNAFVASATSEQIHTAGRFWGDPHNALIEVGVISGVTGLAAFAWLLWRLVPRVLRPPQPRGWAAASAAVLATFSLYEPLDVTLTPMMFLLLGASAAASPEAVRGSFVVRRITRGATALVLVGGTAIATVGFASSVLEQWGRTHADSKWALERAWAIAPWRISPAEALTIDLAIDGRAGDASAAARARELVNRIVTAHPTNPGVRLLAADVELILGNFDGTKEWIAQHLRLFPNDDVTVPEEEPGISIDVPRG